MKASPKKSRPATQTSRAGSPGRANGFEESMKDLQAENQQLQFDVGERDVEIERMKITLVALNEKLAMVNDISKDGEDHKAYLADSEDKRNNLQAHLQELAQKILQDTEAHELKHDKSLKEIESLRALLLAANESKASLERELLKQADEAKQKYAAELEEKDRAMTAQATRHNKVVSDLQREHLDAISQL